MSERQTHLDAVDDHGVGVRVGFRRIGGGFVHTLYGVRMDDALAIVQSVDDADVQGWPLNLPVQEVREATDSAGQRSLLLMGAAANGHWSASVSAARYGAADPYLSFDVAVRLRQAPAYLGAAYETVAGADWINVSDRLAFPTRDDQGLCIFGTLDPAEVEGGSERSLDLLKTERHADHPNWRLFLPMAPLPAQYPATYRWRYSIAAALS